jgi:hypothetical protein
LAHWGFDIQRNVSESLIFSSQVDCFELTLSAVLEGEFVTADRHEMEAFSSAQGFKIRQLR